MSWSADDISPRAVRLWDERHHPETEDLLYSSRGSNRSSKELTTLLPPRQQNRLSIRDAIAAMVAVVFALIGALIARALLTSTKQKSSISPCTSGSTESNSHPEDQGSTFSTASQDASRCGHQADSENAPGPNQERIYRAKTPSPYCLNPILRQLYQDRSLSE